jgi:transcriptional regulator with XRE-family HTH domain
MVTKEEINGCFLEAVRRLKAQGFSQKDIVKAAGLSQNAISKIKTGQNNAGDDTINKLCTAFNLNPDFFYRGSRQFMMEEKKYQSPMIDNGSAINAALAAKDETIENMKARIADLKDTIADKEEIIKSRDARILELERRIAQSNADDLSKYHFPIGAAERSDKPNL